MGGTTDDITVRTRTGAICASRSGGRRRPAGDLPSRLAEFAPCCRHRGAAAEEHGINLVSFDRAGYGHSSRDAGPHDRERGGRHGCDRRRAGARAPSACGGSPAAARTPSPARRCLPGARGRGAGRRRRASDLPGLDFSAGMGECSPVEFPLASAGLKVYGRTSRGPSRHATPPRTASTTASPPSSRRSIARSWRAAASTTLGVRPQDRWPRLYGWLDDGLATMWRRGASISPRSRRRCSCCRAAKDLMVPAGARAAPWRPSSRTRRSSSPRGGTHDARDGAGSRARVALAAAALTVLRRAA